MKITPSSDDENRKVELNETESRQGRTGQKVRYVLIFGLGGIVLCFILIGIAFNWGS
jgi:hypothetical protein